MTIKNVTPEGTDISYVELGTLFAVAIRVIGENPKAVQELTLLIQNNPTLLAIANKMKTENLTP